MKITIDDFVAYRLQHSYFFLPSRELWPAASVNAEIADGVVLLDKITGKPVLDKDGNPVILKAAAWLDLFHAVQQATWAPGLPMLIKDRLVTEGGWIDKPSTTVLNLYRPPAIKLGNARKAGPWLDHLHKIYPGEADHIAQWLAHRVQRPQDKINHALMLGGAQGIGKDTLLEPVKYAVGSWNFVEASPTQIMGRFNGFLKAVILRMSEARDLGESNRFAAYDHMKTYTAAPPDVLRIDEKHMREYYIMNCCGVIITSNYKTDGIYLPADDRRHYVAWSDLRKEDFSPTYWKKLWGWYASGGMGYVAAYLAKLDISAFDAKAPPPKTPAFWAIVDANRAPEEGELADVLDKLKNPNAVTLDKVIHCAEMNLTQWLEDRKNRRTIPHRMEKVGYVPVRNDDADSGLWRIASGARRINGRFEIETVRQVIYAKNTLPLREQLEAAEELRQQATAAAKKAVVAAKAAAGKANGKKELKF